MILPSAYFGNIEYFHQIWKRDVAIIDHFEPYQKQTFRSRCEIIGANGVQILSVPVERPQGKDTLMVDVLISYAEDWRKDHLKAIESAYARTPYYIYYIDGIQEIIMKDHECLWTLNTELTRYLSNKIGLSAEIALSRESFPLQDDDFRKDFTSKKQNGFTTHRYIQTFEERHGFQNNLSILDLLFNEGPNTISILQESDYSSL